MPTVSAGATGAYTFTAAQTLMFTLDPSESLVYNVTRSGATIANGRATNGRSIGPYLAGDVASITAQRGDVDYAVANYTNPNLSAADVAATQALVSGDRIADAVSRNITSADNGKSLSPTVALTYTIPAGLVPMPSFTVDCPAVGTISIARSTTATLNSAGTTLTRTRAANPVGFVVLAHESDAYGVSGA